MNNIFIKNLPKPLSTSQRRPSGMCGLVQPTPPVRSRTTKISFLKDDVGLTVFDGIFYAIVTFHCRKDDDGFNVQSGESVTPSASGCQQGAVYKFRIRTIIVAVNRTAVCIISDQLS